jgi:hypothetical protein
MNRLLIFLPFVAFTGSISGASNCPTGGTTIYFGNGIRTDQITANDSLKGVRALTEAALDARAPGRDRSCVQYQLSFDSQFVGSNGEPIDGNAFLQLADALFQKGLLDYSRAWAVAKVNDLTLGLAPGVADVIGQSISDLTVSITAPLQRDLQQHRMLYQSDLNNGNNVIVVAHSQGNLYVDEAYRLVTVPPGRTFTVIAVASPGAHTVSDSGVWVTLVNDIIRLLVPDSLDSNIINFIPNDRCKSDFISRVSCHDFDSSYMVGDQTRPAIVSAVLSKLQPNPSPLEWLSFVEGDPGLPGDGQVVNGNPYVAVGGQTQYYFDLSSYVPLNGVTNGVTVTVFPPANTSVATILIGGQARFVSNPVCAQATWGPSTSSPQSVVVNGIQGWAVNVSQSTIQHIINGYLSNQCAVTLADLYITSLIVFSDNPGQHSIIALDAAAIGVGQNAIPH